MKKSTNGILLVPHYEMKPFLVEIKGCMKELHTAIQLYELELKSQGYNEDQAAAKAKIECLKIKQEIVQEDAEGIL